MAYGVDASSKLTTLSALGWSANAYFPEDDSYYKFSGWATSKANAEAGKVWKEDGAWFKNAIAEGKTLNVYVVWTWASGGGTGPSSWD